MKSCFLLTVLVAAALSPAERCSAETFHSARYGYSLEIPQGWVAVPPGAIEEYRKGVATPANQVNVRFDTAFQQSATSAWFGCPYVIVQVIEYGDVGLDRQIRMDEIKRFVASLSPASKTPTTAMSCGEPLLDANGRAFSWSVTRSQPPCGVARQEVTGFFGKIACVKVTFCVPQEQWPQNRDTCQAMMRSFVFDPAAAYETASTANWRSTLRTGAFTGAIAAAAFVLYRARRARANSPDVPEP